MKPSDTSIPYSIEYLPGNEHRKPTIPLTDEQVAARGELHEAWNEELYNFDTKEPTPRSLETYGAEGVDIGDIERLAGQELSGSEVIVVNPSDISQEASKITTLTNESLKRDFGQEPEVTEADATEVAIALKLEGKSSSEIDEPTDEKDGMRIELAKRIGSVLEGNDLAAKEDVLRRFKNPEDARKIVQRVYEIGEEYGSVENATTEALVGLGALIESALTVEPEVSDIIVTEEPGGEVEIASLEEEKQKREEALAAAEKDALAAAQQAAA